MHQIGTIHYTQLAPGRPDSSTAREWETYRREVGRLLAEGNEGRFALIHGDEIVALFFTEDEAKLTGYQKYLLGPFLVQQVREYEPLYFDRRVYYNPYYVAYASGRAGQQV